MFENTLMQITPVSSQPHSPSLLLKTSDSVILLDCAMDMNQVATFLPHTIFSQDPLWMKKSQTDMDRVATIGAHNFIDHCTEFAPSIPAEVPDAILISNWTSLLALPFITERAEDSDDEKDDEDDEDGEDDDEGEEGEESGEEEGDEDLFDGVIYATEPTIQLGRLMMLELIRMVGDDRGSDDSNSSSSRNWMSSVNWSAFPSFEPSQLCPLYTEEEMERSLARVKTIYLRQPIKLPGGLTATAYGSGHSIGSCNWVIESHAERVAYLSSSSLKTSHVKPADWSGLTGCGTLVATSMALHTDMGSLEEMLINFVMTVGETLRKGGNVLLPVMPTGLTYELVDTIFNIFYDPKHSISRDVPVYFISTVGKAALSYGSICPEWLSKQREERAYIPEDPFSFAEMIKSGRLKLYNTVSDELSREVRTPCVVFAAHPSLRDGAILHFLDMWGNDPNSAIIMTDPDYPLKQFYDPFKELKIRAYFFPMETRLSLREMEKEVLPKVAPNALVLPELYRHDSGKALAHLKGVDVVYYEEGQEVDITADDILERVPVSDAVLKEMKLGAGEAIMLDDDGDVDMTSSSSIQLVPVRAAISAYDYDVKIIPARSSEEPAIRCGELTVEALREAVPKRITDFKVTQEVTEAGPIDIIEIKYYANARIVISDGGMRTRITCSDPVKRRELMEAISKCLSDS